MKQVLTSAALLAAILALPAGIDAQNIDLAADGADQIWHGHEAGARAGVRLDIGPMNTGDSRRDLIIGSPGNSTVGGRVYILFGGPVFSGHQMLTSAHVTIHGLGPGDGFGQATAAGSVTVNESFPQANLIVAAPQAYGGRGAVFVFPAGLSHGTLTTADAVFTVLGAPGDALGSAIATADINNDGYRELVLGAPGNNRIYIIVGHAGLSGTRDLSTGPADLLITGEGIGSVIQAHDVTGNGVYDLLIGSAAQNAVYLLTGGYKAVTALPADADAVYSGIDPGDAAGASLRLADLDGNGQRDIIIGAPGGDGPNNTRHNAGEAYVIWGGRGWSRPAASPTPT